MDFVVYANTDEMPVTAGSTGWEESCLSESRLSIRKGCVLRKLARGLEGMVVTVMHVLTLNQRGKWTKYPSESSLSMILSFLIINDL